ncbi:MAG: DNA repair protein RadC [Melioribacteraceae bacterium]|nr:DNA repair protein RadC [Melioribacteraceae bacterium]
MYKVKELPIDDRPREKLVLRGPQSLSDAELVAILLRTGTKGNSVISVARELILEFGNLAVLAGKSVDSMTKINGIGKDKAATLCAAFEISRRIDSKSKWFSNKVITAPSDVAAIFNPLLRDELKENFLVVCLNANNQIIKYETVSIGSLNASIVHPREIYKIAIECSSANIILLHNHPSGNSEPSKEDISITKRLVDAGKLLDIQVFDHIILTGRSYTSFIERRLI